MSIQLKNWVTKDSWEVATQFPEMFRSSALSELKCNGEFTAELQTLLVKHIQPERLKKCQDDFLVWIISTEMLKNLKYLSVSINFEQGTVDIGLDTQFYRKKFYYLNLNIFKSDLGKLKYLELEKLMFALKQSFISCLIENGCSPPKLKRGTLLIDLPFAWESMELLNDSDS